MLSQTRSTGFGGVSRALLTALVMSLLAWAAGAQEAASPGADAVAADGAASDTVATDAAAGAAAADETAGDAEAGNDAAVPVTRFELGISMDELADAGDYAAASALVDDWLERSEAELEPRSAALAEAYFDAARVQSLDGEYESATENALKSLELYQAADGPFAPSLIEPYLLLGDNYSRARDFVSALSAYGEARTVSRRVYGLLNAGQIEIIDRMTAAAEQLNQIADAQAFQVEALTLIERTHEVQSPEFLNALYRYAAWLRSKHLFTAERDQYLRADRIIREHYGSDSLFMVRPLRERANSFRTQGVEESLGISGLREALEIVEAQPDPDPVMLAEVLRDIGDWDVAFSRIGSDGEAYLRSWNVLGRAENGDELRKAWYQQLGTSGLVYEAPLSQRDLSIDPNAPEGHVIVQFVVDKFGRTDDVQIIESDPPGLKDEAFLRQYRQSRFRPTIRGGELVSERRAFDIRFRYKPRDED